MSAQTPATGAPVAGPRTRPGLDLFVASFAVLFLELAAIRWFGATVVFLTFFTNIVLLASFVGVTVGCLAAARKADLVRFVLPATFAAVFLSLLVLSVYETSPEITIDVGDQQKSPEEIFFGTNYRTKDPSKFVVPIEVVGGAFFVLVAVIFVGLGQAMGRAFDALPDRVAAYAVNILGSIAGIAAFTVASYARTTPRVWFLVAAILVLVLARRRSAEARPRIWTAVQVLSALALVLATGTASSGGPEGETLWSPYYKIHYRPQSGEIFTNNMTHQDMIRVGEAGAAYALPHLLARDAGVPPFDDVLVIGAGSGNDVQAALEWGARHVDAVEIDPVLAEIGKADHPERPYDNERVDVSIEDGRRFLKETERRYDLVVYALVDSLVLHTAYSSLRLESFLFTEEAFRDVKAVLKPGGVFVLYNFYRRGWVVLRIARLAERAFGTPPLVLSLPFQKTISPGDDQSGRRTCILAGEASSHALTAVRGKLQSSGSFWVNENPGANEGVSAYGEGPPVSEAIPEATWSKIAAARLEGGEDEELPTDDWPFLYLRDRTVPALNLRGMAVVAGLFLVFVLLFAPVRRLRPSGRMFFLGAGFMLLETKGVVQMALLFGATWITNSVVFFAILILILAANLFVLLAKPRRIWPFGLLVLASLAGNVLLPESAFLVLPAGARIGAVCAIVFVPILFAGVLFAVSFRESRAPAADLGWNLAGVVAGGLAENLSLVLGFDRLLLVAAGFYLLALILGRQRTS
ncbi:MAG: hypothetical protein HY720_20720 [Planctomycetes bacterium]|nr:hypothetical protein [Planctomycetota bacterium]